MKPVLLTYHPIASSKAVASLTSRSPLPAPFSGHEPSINLSPQQTSPSLRLLSSYSPQNTLNLSFHSPSKPSVSFPSISIKPHNTIRPRFQIIAAALRNPLEELIDRLVKRNKVAAFIKGSRSAPLCGFSQRVKRTYMVMMRVLKAYMALILKLRE